MIRLQRCEACRKAQYPARDFCGACLSDRIGWETAESLPGRVLGRTTLHHSNEPLFRDRLPLTIGLVQLDAGPVALCFVPETATAGDAVELREDDAGLLSATGAG